MLIWTNSDITVQFASKTTIYSSKRYTIDFKIASTQHNTVQVYVPIKYGTLNVVLPLLHIRTPRKTTIKFNKNYISNAIPPTLTCI